MDTHLGIAAANARGTSAGAERIFSVYVVELSSDAAEESQYCFYVGETALAPAERYQKHLAGGRTSAAVVRRHGRRLRPDLVLGEGPFATRAEAVAAEARVADRLRSLGHEVFGGQGRSFSMRRRPGGGGG